MIKKPWGSEVVIFESGQARVKLLRVKPGKRLSLQYHERKREAMMLISGEALLEHGPYMNYVMEPGEIYQITTGVKHRLSGQGRSEAVILEMAHGSDEDIVRLADDYGRATTTATQPAGGQ